MWEEGSMMSAWEETKNLEKVIMYQNYLLMTIKWILQEDLIWHETWRENVAHDKSQVKSHSFYIKHVGVRICHSQWSGKLAVWVIYIFSKHSHLFQFSRRFSREKWVVILGKKSYLSNQKSLIGKNIEKINGNLRFRCITARYKC